MPCALGAPGSPTNPTWELLFAPGPKSSLRGKGGWVLDPAKPRRTQWSWIPDGSALRGWKPPAQPRFHNHPTPSLRAPFPAQTLPRASVSHPVSISSGQTRSSEGKIHPLLMCRGRSWHGHGCDQNYSPKVQPWNFYCGSQLREKGKRAGGKKKPKRFVLTNGLFEQDYFLTPR